MLSRRIRAAARLVVLACGLITVGTSLHAQGNTEPRHILQTGNPPLISATVDLNASAMSGPVGLQFFFGFATDEEIQPGQLLDSFVIGVQNQSMPAEAALYLVVDASGLVLAPPTPGMIPLDPAMISLTSVSFPSGLSSLEHRVAFSFFAAVPESLAQQPFTLYFDLFDNGDLVNSLAWASDVVLVPEPRATVLILVSMVVCAVRCRKVFGRASGYFIARQRGSEGIARERT